MYIIVFLMFTSQLNKHVYLHGQRGGGGERDGRGRISKKWEGRGGWEGEEVPNVGTTTSHEV